MEPKGITVIDVETTGLFPNGHDRIIEIAAIKINPDGIRTDQFETLVNPNRDVGPTFIHKITSREVQTAPYFNEIAGDVLGFISDSILVGHNVVFDLRFIRAEFARLGIELPAFPYACTLALSRIFAPALNCRKLGSLCSELGIDYTNAHSAIYDAQATTEILQNFGLFPVDHLCEYIRYHPEELCNINTTWPQISKSGRVQTRCQALALLTNKPCYLGQLVMRLENIDCKHASSNEYLDLLDRALEDRRVTREEADRLEICAIDLGLSRSDVVSLHHDYMGSVMRAALSDGIITEPEKEDLEKVRILLGISAEWFHGIMHHESLNQRETKRNRPSHCVECFGKKVCFTGSLKCCINGERASRGVAIQIAEEAGMIIQQGVTKSLDYLVAADPDSLSGKARKAHEYNVRVIAEPVFWQMVGMDPH